MAPSTNLQSSPSKGDRGGLGARGGLSSLTAVVLLLSGIVMAFIALFLPPPGQIHDSVLYIFAQILIYVGSIFGIGAYIRKEDKKP